MSRSGGERPVTSRPCLSELVGRSLEVLREERPEHAQRVARYLEGLWIDVVLPEERFCIGASTPERPLGVRRIASNAERAMPVERTTRAGGQIDVRLDRHVVIDLVEGSVDLRDALATGRVELWGIAEQLARLDHALRWYVHGAIRSRGHRALRVALTEMRRA